MEDKITITEQSFQRLEEKEAEQVTGYRHSVWKEIRKEFLSNKAALFSMVFLSVILIAVLLAPLSPYDPYEIDISQKMQGMSASHIFGTDDYGRDYLTRALYGGRVSLLVGFCSMFITVIIGTTIGVFSGYIGGKLDMILMHFSGPSKYASDDRTQCDFAARTGDAHFRTEPFLLGAGGKNHTG